MSEGMKTGELSELGGHVCFKLNALQSEKCFTEKLEALQFENKGFANAKAKEP